MAGNVEGPRAWNNQGALTVRPGWKNPSRGLDLPATGLSNPIRLPIPAIGPTRKGAVSS